MLVNPAPPSGKIPFPHEKFFHGKIILCNPLI